MKKENTNFGFSLNSEKTFYAEATGKTFHLYLGDIDEPSEYHSWCQLLRSTTPADDVFIHINSNGGRLDTTTQLIQAIHECQGRISASIEGNCCSAATMIFLTCDQYQLSPYTYFMIHNFSGGMIGKGNEMQSRAEFEKRWFDNMAYSLYKNFLSDVEISEMLRGVDFYMDAKEVHARMTKRNKLARRSVPKKPKAEKVAQEAPQ